MQLFHYRSIKSALTEIEKGTFHFSSCEELNDPLEGYLRVYWQGDKAAWEALFINYIQSLLLSIFHYRLGVGYLHGDNIVIIDTKPFDDVPMGRFLKRIGDAFLESKLIIDLTRFYGETSRKCFSSELSFVFQLIHQSAFKKCLEFCIENRIFTEDESKSLKSAFFKEDNNLYSNYDFYSILSVISHNKRENYLEAIKFLDYTYKDKAESWILNLSKDVETVLFGQDFGKDDEEITETGKKRREWLEIVIDFPELYLNQLRTMIYPQGYFVCFSEKGDISPMWGNYAENHKGICIIYDLDQSKEFRIKIKDNDFQTLKPKKVDYGGETIERNFFETLGRMPIPQIIRFLTGKDGVVSNCYKVYQTEDVWRSAYWDAFEAKNYRKLDAWSYEKEYRINLTDMFYEFGDISSRDLEYDPSILKGVIFGIKTPEYYKRKVYDALFNKRHIFKEVTFYQAVFDEEEQNIKIRKKEGWEL